MDWFASIPIVTRCWVGLAMSTSIGVHFGYINPWEFAWSWEMAYYHNQWWRSVTAFLFVGELSISLVVNCHFLLQVGWLRVGGKAALSRIHLCTSSYLSSYSPPRFICMRRTVETMKEAQYPPAALVEQISAGTSSAAQRCCAQERRIFACLSLGSS